MHSIKPAVGLHPLPEGLDHCNALDEHHRRRVHVTERRIVGRDILVVAAELRGIERRAEKQRNRGRKREAPVNPNQITEGHDRSDDGRNYVCVGMANQVMQRSDVIL